MFDFHDCAMLCGCPGLLAEVVKVAASELRQLQKHIWNS